MGTFLPRGRRRRPYCSYSLESEVAPRTACGKARSEGALRGSANSGEPRAPTFLKAPWWAWPVRRAPPLPAPPRRARRIPGPAVEGRGSLAWGQLAAPLRERDRETKGRIPPLPAVSRPPGIFPRPGTLPPALPRSLPVGSGSFQKRLAVGKRDFLTLQRDRAARLSSRELAPAAL